MKILAKRMALIWEKGTNMKSLINVAPNKAQKGNSLQSSLFWQHLPVEQHTILPQLHIIFPFSFWSNMSKIGLICNEISRCVVFRSLTCNLNPFPKTLDFKYVLLVKAILRPYGTCLSLSKKRPFATLGNTKESKQEEDGPRCMTMVKYNLQL